MTRPPPLWPRSPFPWSKVPWISLEPASRPVPAGRDQPHTMQQKGNAVSTPKGAPARPIPFAACCCSRILRVRGVVPLGMLMMYFPSISAVTRRRLVGTARLSSSRRARAAGEDGASEHLLGWNVLGWRLDAQRRAQMCPLSPCFQMTVILIFPTTTDSEPPRNSEGSTQQGCPWRSESPRGGRPRKAPCGSVPAPRRLTSQPSQNPLKRGKLLGDGKVQEL